jgi:hypothetical protein
MELFAHYALFLCIVASGLGGVAISFVAFRYGLVPPDQDDPIDVIRRRLFVTQVSHAIAAVAFSVSALSASVVMVVGMRPTTAESRGTLVLAERLDHVESLVRRMTDSLDRTVDRIERRKAAQATP